MISLIEARELVSAELEKDPICNAAGEIIDRLVILDQHTMTRPYGWVFFYQSERFLRGYEGGLLYGNSPILVTKIDGALHEIGTAGPPDELLKAWDEGKGARYLVVG